MWNPCGQRSPVERDSKWTEILTLFRIYFEEHNTTCYELFMNKMVREQAYESKLTKVP
jgi:hypothetical protein